MKVPTHLIHSIRVRLVVWYAGLLILVALSFGAYTYAWVNHYLREAMTASVMRRSLWIGNGLVFGMHTTGEAFVIAEIEALYAPSMNDRFIRVTRGDGSILYCSHPPKDKSFNPHQIPLPVNSTEPTNLREEKIPGNSTMLIVTRPFEIDSKLYRVEVGEPERPSDAVLHGLLWTLALGLPVIVGVGVGGGYILIGGALRPVRRMVKGAQEISLYHLSRRLPVTHTGDELEELSLALNEMMERLDTAFQHASRFSSDASHELRTPLTIMRGELEEALAYPQIDPQMREKVGSILEETGRLTRVVEGLFAISRLDTGEAAMKMSRFDLYELTTTTLEQMQLLADDKEIALTCTCQSSGKIEVKGDRARLKQVVVNLLDNAIKYTPPHGRIEVNLTLAAEKNLALLQVRDSGPGISPEALPHLFERFFRAEEARSLGIEGAGLGLSIVRSICLAHGGSIEAASPTDGGALFTARIPIAIDTDTDTSTL